MRGGTVICVPSLKRTVMAAGRAIPTDSEGYLLNLGDWSEDFAQALAREEGLELTPEHWEVIRFLRQHYHEHGVQAQVRVMIRHFTKKSTSTSFFSAVR